MIGIAFDRDRAAYFLDCIIHGRPIEGVRKPIDLLTLAVACHCIVSNADQAAGFGVDLAGVREPPDAEKVPLIVEMIHATLLASFLAEKVLASQYDAEHRPRYRAIVFQQGGQRA